MSYIGNQPTSTAFLTDYFSGNNSTTAFTMSVAPATTSSLLVTISGVLQDPTAYSVVGTTITFSAAPPSGSSNIVVRYLGIPASGVTTTAYRTVTEFTATSGQTTFSPPSYTVGYINVFRNGVRLGAADFTATNGTTVVLASGASAGDLITTESFYISSAINALATTGGTINAASGATPLVVQNNGTTALTVGSSGEVAFNGSTFTTSSNMLSIQTGRILLNKSDDWGMEMSGANTGRIRFYSSAGGQGTTVGSVSVNSTSALFNAGNVQLNSNGISFPAAQNASSDANTLDDYEEGTFTPNVYHSSTNNSTFTSKTGNYVKIGKLVIASWQCDSGNSGTSGSALTIGGLPFTSQSYGSGNQSFGIWGSNTGPNSGNITNVSSTAGLLYIGGQQQTYQVSYVSGTIIYMASA